MGNSEARKAYEKLLSDNADQQEIAARALRHHGRKRYRTGPRTENHWSDPNIRKDNDNDYD